MTLFFRKKLFDKTFRLDDEKLLFKNIISFSYKNIYDDNSSEFMSYYEKNYYNDWNGEEPYIIENSNFKDYYSSKHPYYKNKG